MELKDFPSHQAFYEHHIQVAQSKNLSLAEYGRRYHIRAESLYYANGVKRRRQSQEPSKKNTPAFVRIGSKSAEPQCCFVIHLNEQIKIECSSCPPADWVKSLLEAQSC